MSEYKLDLDNRKLIQILDSKGIPVSIDQTNPIYASALTWIAKQPEYKNSIKGYGSLEQGAQYFCDKASVIEYCKSHGIVLFVDSVHASLHFGGSRIVLEHSDDTVVAHPVDTNLNITFIPVYGSRHVLETHPYNSGGLTPTELPEFYVSSPVLQQMDNDLTKEDSDVRRLSSWQVERTFVYVDVSGFSTHPIGHQLAIINAINAIANRESDWDTTGVSEARDAIRASICIGDGYIFVFESPGSATLFAAYFATLIEHRIAHKALIEFHFRISVHTGEVYRFWDQAATPGEGRWNYVGKGIIDGQRVLSAIGSDKDDVVYISGTTRSKLLAMDQEGEEIVASQYLQNRGRHADKHGNMQRLYEVSHTSWMAESVYLLPPLPKPS